MIPPDSPLLQDIPLENREASVALGQVLKRLHKHISSMVMQGMQAELIELDLSFSQMTALHQLRAGSGMTVTELSERTRLSLPAASHLVEKLVQRGLALREENPENRREKVVKLSEAGLKVLSGMDSGFVGAYISAFARLNPSTIRAAETTLRALLDEIESNQARQLTKENA